MTGSNGTSLNREQIFAARKDRRPIRLDVPEWGGHVFLRHLTVADQMALSETTPADMTTAVLIAAVVDENDMPVFDPEDAEELRKESFAVVLRVFSEAARINGLSTKELDEAMASFGTTPVEPGSSDSPSHSADPSQNSVTSPVPS